MRPSFERQKLLRFIKTNGKEYTFTKAGVDRFGEPSDIAKTVCLPGVYHETEVYVSVSADTAAAVKTKPQSMIMCLMEDAANLEDGMTVTISGKLYTVKDRRDVNNFGVACDISLEVVLT